MLLKILIQVRSLNVLTYMHANSYTKVDKPNSITHKQFCISDNWVIDFLHVRIWYHNIWPIFFKKSQFIFKFEIIMNFQKQCPLPTRIL